MKNLYKINQGISFIRGLWALPRRQAGTDHLVRVVIPLLLSSLLFSCEEELPGEGSIPDKTPPSAEFSYAANEANYELIAFTNLSVSATDFTWDFGDGGNSTDRDPSHTYAADGTYTVSLIAKDKNELTSTITQTVEIKEPEVVFEPVILNSGFDEEGEDSYRDHWRNSDLGGALQITSNPIHEGVKAGKLPADGTRIAYQLITVEQNKDYTVSFFYTMLDSPAGSLKVAILGGHVTDPAAVEGATIESVTLTDQSDPSAFVSASVSFNSGDSNEIAIFISNVDVECRFDTFTIAEN